MATVNVSLPDPMKDWVEAQTKTGRYGNASDYVRDLIRRDQERAGKLIALRRCIDEGEASGMSPRDGPSERQGSRVARMSGYRLTRQADRNLIDIYLYTAERFGIRQADCYADGLQSTFNVLVENPKMGRAADEIRPGIRRHEHAGHVIFYRQTGEGLLMVAIIHHRMRPDLDWDE